MVCLLGSLFVETINIRPTLLVSGVAVQRSADLRETVLTELLMERVFEMAGDDWNVVVSWGEVDGAEGTLKKLAQADAVVVMGGPDVSPEFYGGTRNYANETPHFPRTDEAQIALAQEAVERQIPLLGICRGMQILNVALGGTLVQDISERPGHANPDLMADFRFDRHHVNVRTDSHLGGILSPLAVVGAGDTVGFRTEVHSAHHQAVDVVGLGLAVSATASDGTVEAVEHLSAPAVGVQWHPEDPDADPRGLQFLLGCMRQHCVTELAA